MSTPTGPGPDSPQWGQQPEHSPAPSYSGGPAGYGGAPGQRPGTVTAAAVIAVVWGGIGALFGLLVTLAAFGLGTGLAGLIFLLSTVFSVALLVGGINVLQGKAPRLLLIISYVALGLSLLSLVVSLATSGGNAVNGLIGIVIPGVIVALLRQPQSQQYFAARGQRY